MRRNFPGRCAIMLAVLTWTGVAFSAEIHEAARQGDVARVEVLLQNNPSLVSSRAESIGWTPLHFAVVGGHNQVAAVLLAHRADVNAKDNMGWTPLHWAVDTANLHTRCGQGGCELPVDIAKRNAAELALAKLLLSNRADVNATTNDGSTPLHFAARDGDKEMAKLLLAARADVNVKDSDGWTPLHWAADRESGDVVELLLANNAIVDAKAAGGYTPLDFAASVGDKTVVAFLLAHEADVNAIATDGGTPLRIAIYTGHNDIAEFLREHGGH